MKKISLHKIILLFAAAFILLTTVGVNKVQAAKPLDEILLYSITADVLDDASVDLTYDIAWKVLDSDSEGPLEWVQIGIPNNHVNEIVGLSDTVSSINTKSSGGYYAVVYFDRKYYKDEVVNFSFKVNMDYLYQVYPEEGKVEYNFTPGWFDGITVDQLILKWNSDKIDKFEPSGCIMEDGYHVWSASLDPGEKFSIELSYPIDAYAFDLSVHNDDDNDYKFEDHSPVENVLFVILCIIVFIFIILLCASPILIPAVLIFLIYKASTGFRLDKTKKVTRTIIEYYDSCPNCGGSRGEGKEVCSYCGSNMVKSKQEIKEEDIPKTDKALLDFKTNGEYRYSDNPNRYVRVNVITVPHVTRVPQSAIRSSSSSGRSHHSSCAHSSCACACACACAGGGRAGCSTKDFYNTDFKLSYLKKFKKQ